MATEWSWGSDKKAVAMTEVDAKSLVAAIAAEVTKVRESDLLDQFRQFARLEMELAKERETVARLTAEVAALRQHITTLNTFLTTAIPVPVFQERVAASSPLPTLLQTPAPE